MPSVKFDSPKSGNAKEPNSKDAVKCRRWKKELDLAAKRDKDYIDVGEKIWKRYRGEEKKRNRYNVLWANTEILKPSIFNSKPEPDVRRRFRDSDPLGKAVGLVLERSLAVMLDGDSTVDAIGNDVLDALLPGRGVSRIRYVPKLGGARSTGTASDADPDTSRESDSAVNASLPPADREGSHEQVEDEQVIVAHTNWRDFRHGYGRTWDEVPWTGFRHKLSRTDVEKQFGAKVAKKLKYTVQKVEDQKARDQQQETAKLAEVWEIWNKDGGDVFFISEQLEECLYPTDNKEGKPPLDFEGFFPCPKPLRFMDDSDSLKIVPPFHLYEEQAAELDRITLRIDKIVGACRVRGIYDSALREIKDLLSSDDNELTPVQNAKAYMAAGGLGNAVHWFPIEQAVAVLEALYTARDNQLKIIDQLTGISDIVRGVTDPDETLGAQKMKGGYFSIRLWRHQQEAKRYGRDLLRLASDAMCQRFGADTFARMTDLKFPKKADKLKAQFQLQQLKAQAQQQPPAQPGQPPPPPPQPPPELLMMMQLPTWEDILAMMRTPAMRQYRVDVETDSMISGTLESDMTSLGALLESLIKFLEGIAPLVQAGAIPVDAVKELTLTIIRRARMGTAVEDAFDKMQAPKPPQSPQDSKPQVAQIQAQSDEKIEGIKQQGQQALQQMRENAENQRLSMREFNDNQRTHMQDLMKSQRDELDTKLDAFVKLLVATISATKQPDQATLPATEQAVLQGAHAQPPNGAPNGSSPPTPPVQPANA
jgi:hypothetical protein